MDGRQTGFESAGLSRLDDLLKGYVDDGKLAGITALLWQGGSETYFAAHGMADINAGLPMARDTVFRVYSMTKPIASVALMMLWEEGLFDLDDPVAKFLPEFDDMKVWVSGEGDDMKTVAADKPITVRHLLTHTSGLVNPRFEDSPLQQMYADAGLAGSNSKGTTAEIVGRLASLPLGFHPGTQWRYSMATDIVGYLVSVLSGKGLDEFLQERIFDPLGMTETGFQLTPELTPRFAANYGPDEAGGLKCIDDPATSKYREWPAHLSGGGGLVSTADDYLRFARMVLGGGTFDGMRIIKSETADLMRQNHLPADIDQMGGAFNQEDWHGIGFGLGYSVILDPATVGYGNRGLHGWTGAASTLFFVDPEIDLIAMTFAQFMPSYAYPLRAEFRRAVYAALG